jgi:hypothetical protein
MLRSYGGAEKVWRRWEGPEMLTRCRGAEVLRRCGGTEMPRRCGGAEVLRRCGSKSALPLGSNGSFLFSLLTSLFHIILSHNVYLIHPHYIYTE